MATVDEASRPRCGGDGVPNDRGQEAASTSQARIPWPRSEAFRCAARIFRRVPEQTYFVTVCSKDPTVPLTQPFAVEIMRSAFRFLEQEGRWTLWGYVIMPDHVHLCALVLAGFTVSQVMKSWKNFTARAINQILGRRGAFWQRSFYETAIRGERDAAQRLDYMFQNPVCAGLCHNAEDWPWSWCYGKDL